MEDAGVDSFERLKMAVDELFLVFAKEIGTFQLVEWLMSKLEKRVD